MGEGRKGQESRELQTWHKTRKLSGDTGKWCTKKEHLMMSIRIRGVVQETYFENKRCDLENVDFVRMVSTFLGCWIGRCTS